MEKKKVAILGGSGFVGAHLARALQEDGVFIVDSFSHAQWDVCSSVDCARAALYDVVVNCAAISSPARCQQLGADRLLANHPQQLFEGIGSSGTLLIQMSTDQVFDGNAPNSSRYSVDSVRAPINDYSASKVRCEDAVRNTVANYAIFRLSVVLGSSGGFLGNFLLPALRSAGPVRLFTDELRNFTYLGDIVEAVKWFAKEPRDNGVYHIMCPLIDGPTSRFDLGTMLRELLASETELQSCLQSEMPSKVERPLNLSCHTKLEFLRGLRAALSEIVNQ